ncbi:MAG: aspartyl/asparaginyl beta-hydroxylase domain-containing protein [Gammaproteobacteria bacterium]
MNQYINSDTSNSHELLIKGDRLLSERRLDEAGACFEMILDQQPEALDALLRMAQVQLLQSRIDPCLATLDTAIEYHPHNAELRFRRGTILHSLGRFDEARAIYHEAVSLQPDHVPALLKLGSCCMALGDTEAAIRAYQGVVTIAGPVGRALQDTRLPEAIRGDVELMHKTLTGKYRDLLESTRAYLRDKYPASELTRIDAALAVLAGQRQRAYEHPQQRPEFMYIPGLRPIPWFEREDFDWVQRVEDAFPEVRAELEALLPERSGFVPYIHGTQGQQASTPQGTDFSHLAGNLSWSAFHLHLKGRIADHCERCPQTAALMDSLPLPEAEGWMPETFFSVLAPGEHIIPHYGQMNGRLTVHLGLIIPPDCGISVCGETRGWEEGKVLAFDDSFLHEAWNRSDADRAVLIFEVWHPDMSEAEIDGVQHFLTTRTRWLNEIIMDGGSG